MKYSTFSHKGYTLLELVVVLAIMGIIMGMATPRLTKMYGAMEFSLQKDDLLFQLGTIPYQAFSKGQEISLAEALTAGKDQLIALPENWEFDTSAKSVTYSPLGFCSGGTVRFSKYTKVITVQLTPPFCKPAIIE